MRGNVSCTGNPDDQAIGYVSVCERSSRRMFIGSAGIYTRPFDPETLLFYPERDEDGYHFNELFLTCSPVDYTGESPNATNVRWGDKICTDCRAWGGTKTKPAWWPNDDV